MLAQKDILEDASRRRYKAKKERERRLLLKDVRPRRKT